MTPATRLKRQRPPIRPGIIHFGLGAFFRAHGALIVEEAMMHVGGDWGIIGVSLKTPDMRDRLQQQDNVYSAIALAPTERTRHISEIITDTIFAPEDPETLLSKMAEAEIKILTLTITEKGYGHIPSTGALDLQRPDIQADIKAVRAGTTPETAIGYIVSALQRRKAAGLRPFTMMSCDNLPENGRILRNVVVAFAAQIDEGLASWVAENACFPSTMVDRIVPATTQADVDALNKGQGSIDLAPVLHEPFCQWVIEDSFVDCVRPKFETVPAVQMVRDVTPFELMKIRMLNGTHSSLAYLGYLAGHETIAETVADSDFHAFVTELWHQEIIPSISAPENIDLTDYANQLLNRYQNAAIRHRTWQIAMDGSQKLPQRLLSTVAHNVKTRRKSHRLLLAIAAWIQYVGGVDLAGRPIDVRDPLALRLRALSDAGGSSSEIVTRFLCLHEVFGSELQSHIKDDLICAHNALVTLGAREAIKMSWVR